MDLKLSGKNALITGSTRGIGFATAAGFAGQGAHVIINGRSQENVEQAMAQIRSQVPEAKISGCAADLASAEGSAVLLKQVPEVDILVNNLGIFEPKDFTDISDADWLRFFETNVMSGVRLARYYFPLMQQRNWGRIVFVSSESGINIPSEMIHYGMTKSAQLAVSQGLAQLTKGTQVTVNCVLPGPTGSEGVATFVEQMAEERHISVPEMEKDFFQNVRPTSLLQRFITPDEVSNLIVYVCSPLASAINGAALRVDGGVVKSII